MVMSLMALLIIWDHQPSTYEIQIIITDMMRSNHVIATAIHTHMVIVDHVTRSMYSTHWSSKKLTSCKVHHHIATIKRKLLSINGISQEILSLERIIYQRRRTVLTFLKRIKVSSITFLLWMDLLQSSACERCLRELFIQWIKMASIELICHFPRASWKRCSIVNSLRLRDERQIEVCLSINSSLVTVKSESDQINEESIIHDRKRWKAKCRHKP